MANENLVLVAGLVAEEILIMEEIEQRISKV